MGLELASPPPSFALAPPVFSFAPSLAEPPEEPLSLELFSLLASSPDSPFDSLEELDPSVLELDAFVEVVEVEVVCTAARSALVSAGGVMSGVLLGAGSETLLPPHAPIASAHNAASAAAAAARGIRPRAARGARRRVAGGALARVLISAPSAARSTAPCAARRWGSR